MKRKLRMIFSQFQICNPLQVKSPPLLLSWHSFALIGLTTDWQHQRIRVAKLRKKTVKTLNLVLHLACFRQSIYPRLDDAASQRKLEESLMLMALQRRQKKLIFPGDY